MLCKKFRLYEDRDDVTLTTYVLDDSAEMRNGKSRGAVLICPGGAYLYCSDREGEPVAMAFAAMGYHAFVLRYSVYNKNRGANTMDNIVPDLSKPWQKKKDVLFPNQIRDVGKAILFIREHAEEWLIDPERIALCGFSAGAHNCAMYSVYYDKPELTEFLGTTPDELRPAAAVLGYMLSDYVTLLEKEDTSNVLFDCSIRAYLGEIETTTKEMAEKVSPSRLVSESTPPMFLWSTASDELVDPFHTLAMAMALNEQHIPYEVHIFEEGKHGMVLATEATADVEGGQVNPKTAVWIGMADTWLRKRLGDQRFLKGWVRKDAD